MRREAVAATAHPGPARIGFGARVGIAAGIAVAAAGLVIGMQSVAGSWQHQLGDVLVPIGIICGALSAVTPMLRRRVAGRGTILATKLWLSPFGSAFFSFAALGITRDPHRLTASVT